MYKTILTSNESESELDKEAIEAHEDDEEVYRPITPPLTPMNISADTIKEYHQETFNEAQPPTSVFSSKPLLAGIAFILIMTVLYSNFRSLKSELQLTNERVAALEQENQILKTALDELTKTLQDPFADEIIQASAFADEVDERRNPPKTKTVWLGNEVEDKVQILDKKHSSLPDYCYFTDEDDLFYDYNVEICEFKRRKLEAKIKKDSTRKLEDDINVDNAWKVEGKKSYDDYIRDTLLSLDDEIHEIKRKRADTKSEEVVEVNLVVETDEKLEKVKNSKRRDKKEKKAKKLQRQKEVGSTEWVEKRTNGREEARKKQEKQQPEINWYLKRKNERAASREADEKAEL